MLLREIEELGPEDCTEDDEAEDDLRNAADESHEDTFNFNAFEEEAEEVEDSDNDRHMDDSEIRHCIDVEEAINGMVDRLAREAEGTDEIREAVEEFHNIVQSIVEDQPDAGDVVAHQQDGTSSSSDESSAAIDYVMSPWTERESDDDDIDDQRPDFDDSHDDDDDDIVVEQEAEEEEEEDRWHSACDDDGEVRSPSWDDEQDYSIDDDPDSPLLDWLML